jgi:hypothetical protein
LAEEVLCTLRHIHKIILNQSYCPEEFLEDLEKTASHINWLVSMNAPKKYSDEYISSNCFSKASWFDNSAYKAFCRVHLQLGADHFTKLVKEIKKEHLKNPDDAISRLWPFLHDTIHDLRPFANFLEGARNKDYFFFEGGKSARAESWALYNFSKALHYSTRDVENPLKHHHKESHAASAFVLRQALELKFERIVGVSAYDKGGGEPKLKHGFHYEFAKKHPGLLDFQGLKFELVKRVYDWCSHIVHNALQPLAWQMPYAFEICKGLFASGDFGPNGGWSIHGGVRVMDVSEMQSMFSQYLLNNYDHGIWCFYFRKPEAADFSPVEMD